MANLQPNYGTQGRLFVGQIANEEKYNAISRTVETAAGIAFGQPAFRGTNDHGVIVYAANAAFVGITVMNPAVGTVATNPDGYATRTTGAFMTSGQTAVVAGGAVNDGDPVYWNTGTGRYTATNTDIRIPGTYFDTTGANGDTVEISVGNRRAVTA